MFQIKKYYKKNLIKISDLNKKKNFFFFLTAANNCFIFIN